MNNEIFGEFIFNIGWKSKTNIEIFNNKYDIIVKASAYFEKDGTTDKQEQSFVDFDTNKSSILLNIQKILNESHYKNITPQMLLFKRDGDYAILFDTNDDDGIAVTIKPDIQIVSQDEYL